MAACSSAWRSSDSHNAACSRPSAPARSGGVERIARSTSSWLRASSASRRTGTASTQRLAGPQAASQLSERLTDLLALHRGLTASSGVMRRAAEAQLVCCLGRGRAPWRTPLEDLTARPGAPGQRSRRAVARKDHRGRSSRSCPPGRGAPRRRPSGPRHPSTPAWEPQATRSRAARIGVPTTGPHKTALGVISRRRVVGRRFLAATRS